MTHPNYPYFAYHIDAWSYVERAQKQLQLFDAGSPESLFYAALELRTGIEARLIKGIKDLLKANNRSEKEIKGYSPESILRQLAKIDADALKTVTLTIGIPGGQTISVLQYIPVTPELAKDWGRVSNLLHYMFFETNPGWYAKRKLQSAFKEMSLVDYRDMLGEIAQRLDNASSGDLLAPPAFLKFFDKLNEDV
jgi:hypothetical protein